MQQRNWCVTKNNLLLDIVYVEEDTITIALQMQEQDRAGFVYKAREMTTSELGELNE